MKLIIAVTAVVTLMFSGMPASAAAPVCPPPTISGAMASGYCTSVPPGDWYYLLVLFKNKAGSYAAYTLRSYRAWTTLILQAPSGRGYYVASAQIIKST